MMLIRFLPALLMLLTACKPAGPVPEAAEGTGAATVKLTFWVSGLECAACAESVRQSVAARPGVRGVVMREGLEGFARVEFDPGRVTAQGIAQAVYEATPLHGTPYEASLRLEVPGLAAGGLAGALEAWRKARQPLVDLEPHWEGKDAFILRLPPLEPGPGKGGAAGWRHDAFLQALAAPLPQGLGLEGRWAEVR